MNKQPVSRCESEKKVVWWRSLLNSLGPPRRWRNPPRFSDSRVSSAAPRKPPSGSWQAAAGHREQLNRTWAWIWRAEQDPPWTPACHRVDAGKENGGCPFVFAGKALGRSPVCSRRNPRRNPLLEVLQPRRPSGWTDNSCGWRRDWQPVALNTFSR